VAHDTPSSDDARVY